MSPAQRRRKAAAAHRRLEAALELLDELARDFRDTPGPTTREDREAWRSTIDAAVSTERARNFAAEIYATP